MNVDARHNERPTEICTKTTTNFGCSSITVIVCTILTRKIKSLCVCYFASDFIERLSGWLENKRINYTYFSEKE